MNAPIPTNQPTLSEAVQTIREVAAVFQGNLMQHQRIQTCIEVIVASLPKDVVNEPSKP